MENTFWQISCKDNFSDDSTETFYSDTMDQAFELAREFVEEGKKVIIHGPIEAPFPSTEDVLKGQDT